MCVCIHTYIYMCVFYRLSTYEIYTVEHRSNLHRTSITIILKMYQASTEFLLEITRGYISIIKCKDPTHCIIRSNKHFIIRREHPTAQRPNTLHNKIQPTFYVYYVHPAISRCRLIREPYRKTNLAADFRFRHAARDQNPCQPHVFFESKAVIRQACNCHASVNLKGHGLAYPVNDRLNLPQSIFRLFHVLLCDRDTIEPLLHLVGRFEEKLVQIGVVQLPHLIFARNHRTRLVIVVGLFRVA